MQTALIMENPGLTGGAATILTECGFHYLGRGIYDLRAESYNKDRQPYPLFWWLAPGGKRILVRWDLYDKTGSWGGYAEAYQLAALAGEKWDAHHVRIIGDRNHPEVFEKRKQFIKATIARYEGYGSSYPISSILLLGTGWDNWTCTPDISEFVRKFNQESDGRVRIVDATYDDFFTAAEQELREKHLTDPHASRLVRHCLGRMGRAPRRADARLPRSGPSHASGRSQSGSPGRVEQAGSGGGTSVGRRFSRAARFRRARFRGRRLADRCPLGRCPRRRRDASPFDRT